MSCVSWLYLLRRFRRPPPRVEKGDRHRAATQNLLKAVNCSEPVPFFNARTGFPAPMLLSIVVEDDDGLKNYALFRYAPGTKTCPPTFGQIMTDPNPADHWNLLASEIGAQPAAEPPRPVVPPRPAAPAQPRPAAMPPRSHAAPPKSSWNELASTLGIEIPPEPQPPAKSAVPVQSTPVPRPTTSRSETAPPSPARSDAVPAEAIQRPAESVAPRVPSSGESRPARESSHGSGREGGGSHRDGGRDGGSNRGGRERGGRDRGRRGGGRHDRPPVRDEQRPPARTEERRPPETDDHFAFVEETEVTIEMEQIELELTGSELTGGEVPSDSDGGDERRPREEGRSESGEPRDSQSRHGGRRRRRRGGRRGGRDDARPSPDSGLSQESAVPGESPNRSEEGARRRIRGRSRPWRNRFEP